MHEHEKKEKSELCQNRCNYQFQATQTEGVQLEENKQQEKIKEAILYCTFCGHCFDLEFE